MRQLISLVLALSSFMIVQTHAQDTNKQYLLRETFANVQGEEQNLTPLVVSSVDNNQMEWTFTDVYAGDHGILLKKGSSITLPALPGLYGNAEYWFHIGSWEPENGKDDYYESLNIPHTLSISHGGLASYTYTETESTLSQPPYIYDGTPESRITFTAGHDIRITGIDVFYWNQNGEDYESSSLFTYSHDSKDEYYAPFDLALKWEVWGYDGAGHDYVVYTTDGTRPTRRSPRYTGPIHITGNTTIRPALVQTNGQLTAGTPHTFTFADKDEKPVKPTNTFEVTVAPGGLKAQVLGIDADAIEGLIIKGQINGDDIKYIRETEGRIAALKYLDLSDATVALDGTHYRTVVVGPPGGMGTYYYFYYYLSETNYDESLPAGRPGVEYTNCFRNDLSSAFGALDKLETVILPKTMKEIGASIFSECQNLKFCPLSDEVTSIGASAFFNTKLRMLGGLPASIEKIGASAFCYGPTFGVLSIPRKVEIGAGAFSEAVIASLDLPFPGDSIYAGTFYSDRLEEINIGPGVQYIGPNAFGGHVKKATLPASIREIGGGAFGSKPTLSPFVQEIEPEGGIRYIGQVAYMLADENQAEYTVRPGTVSLTDRLFYQVQATTFNLPASLEIVGKEAFAYTQLTTLPSMPGVKRINEGAFSYCQKLARVTIPEQLEFLDDAFSDCNALWNVTYNAIDCECPNGVVRSSDKLERVALGDRVRRVPGGLYTYNSNITEAVLPTSVEVIDSMAFYNCTKLQHVNLNDNITAIGGSAFGFCSALTGIHWPLRLESVGYGAFMECEALTDISLPEGMKTIGQSAFLGCSKVGTIYLASTLEQIGWGAFNIFFPFNAPSLTIISPAAEPIPYEWSWNNDLTPTIKVPAASIEKYRADANWGNPYLKANFVPIDQIEPTKQTAITSFAAVSEDTDLSDAVIGDIYVTVGEEDGYDSTDGSIVLNNIMGDDEAEAIGGMAPGVTDLGNRYNGLVMLVPAGTGKVAVSCLTVGTRQLAVKIGEGEPATFVKSEKGDITFDYDVKEDTYIYIYATDKSATDAPAARRARARVAEGDNYIKIYSVEVNPKPTGIGDIPGTQSGAAITGIYTPGGVRVAKPGAPGVYILRRADGTTTKKVMK